MKTLFFFAPLKLNICERTERILMIAFVFIYIHLHRASLLLQHREESVRLETGGKAMKH